MMRSLFLAAAFLVLFAPAKARADAPAEEPYRVIPVGGEDTVELDFVPQQTSMESNVLRLRAGAHPNQLRVMGLGLGKAAFVVQNKAGVIFKKVKFHVIKLESYQRLENVKRILKNTKNVRVSYEGDNIVVDGTGVSEADQERIQKLGKAYPEILNLVSN